MEDLLLKDQISKKDGNGVTVRNSFHRPAPRISAVLYEPETDSGCSDIAILVMHSDADYLSFSAGEELAARGFTVLCANVSKPTGDFDTKIREVGMCVSYLKSIRSIKKLTLLGHSGGGTLMSAYQSIAENGPKIYQKEGMLKKSPDDLAGLMPADGIMLLDSNWGNGAMRLFSSDPAVADENNSHKINPKYDLFNPENGFKKGGSTYSDKFIKTFFMGQHERNCRINDYAASRLAAIESGNGTFDDDEPLVIPGTEQGFFNNKLYAQDIRFMSHTRKPHYLLHKNGIITNEIIYSLRGPENDESFTASYAEGALITTVKNYISSFAIRTTPDYGFNETDVYGIDWDSNYNCTTGNIRHVSAPLLVMGMTGGWEFASAETIFDNGAGTDKTLCYVEGADHFFRPSHHLEKEPGQFGDTLAATYDYVSSWLRQRFM